ncbi:MAG: hypothetical protein V2A78_12475 [bacterium]
MAHNFKRSTAGLLVLILLGAFVLILATSTHLYALSFPGFSKINIDKLDASQPDLSLKKQGQSYLLKAPAMKTNKQTYGDPIPYGPRSIMVPGIFWFSNGPINVPKEGLEIAFDGSNDIYVYLTPTPRGNLTFYSDLNPVEFKNVMKYDVYGLAFKKKGKILTPATLPIKGVVK